VLYALAYALPATMQSGNVTQWGWQAAILSIAPLLMLIGQPVGNADMAIPALLITPCNVGFIAAAILVPLRWRRAALVCAVAALASMVYSGFIVPGHQSELIRGPAGHLGPGYYAWVLAGALMTWTAFSLRPAR
jgi:hypothetical protein